MKIPSLRPLIVIKLGGAALTNKKRICAPRLTVIDSAARQIAAIHNRKSVFIIHGAGSFGHIPVKRFGLSQGFKKSSQLRGLSETKLRLLEWEVLLNRKFFEHGIQTVPFIPSNYILARNGRIVSCNVKPIETWIRLGCVPSTGGDIVPDLATGFSVVSGDQLAVYMAIKLHASMLIFATDVDGIFDCNPKHNQNARLIEKLTLSETHQVAANMTPDVTDVTGGMKSKLDEASNAARSGISVYFVSLLKGRRLQELAMDHKRVRCSVIMPS
jgi:isopentenyl phosphate kinase